MNKIIKMDLLIISKMSDISTHIFSKTFKTSQFHVKDIYLPSASQAVPTETVAGTQAECL